MIDNIDLYEDFNEFIFSLGVHLTSSYDSQRIININEANFKKMFDFIAFYWKKLFSNLREYKILIDKTNFPDIYNKVRQNNSSIFLIFFILSKINYLYF